MSPKTGKEEEGNSGTYHESVLRPHGETPDHSSQLPREFLEHVECLQMRDGRWSFPKLRQPYIEAVCFESEEPLLVKSPSYLEENLRNLLDLLGASKFPTLGRYILQNSSVQLRILLMQLHPEILFTIC